ncbi:MULTISPECIES: hypothetical protein [Methylobacteriaceae]|uniref:Uncharacterized protein n=2 Tax=Methylobacteriaceae TaxID=119045 RepID=A0AA37HNR7_9HYPH|nr:MULTISPECIES: hypothetical protein [Methylobacteriaceae]MDQ0520063.1 hypothetical protein [Methylobacterium gregans]BAU90651.1 hypothetical protein MPPM_2046 [Methylorubrum populi]GJD79174.1 hypothetical protein NBEOAGPD_2395 [Methylobacterium gregans]GLS52464.1 hypothetical protein GCM10007886_06470 [Methylobacterium gregans]
MAAGLALTNPTPVAFPASFDAAVLDGGYRSCDGCWNGYVNRDILIVYAEDAWLGRGEMVERYAFTMQARFRRYTGTPEQPRTWADAGNVIHHALALGLVAEETGPGGERGWRLTSREPAWLIVGTGAQRECRQVRGLPPEQQAAQDKREQAARRRNTTLDRKARVAADEHVARHVRDVLRYDPATVVPEAWARRGYVPASLPGTRLDAAAAVVREAHHAAGMDRPTLKSWVSDLAMEAAVAIVRPGRRQAEQVALPETVEIPDADMTALEAVR